MERALAQGRHAWVMEDDLHFCEDFGSRLAFLEVFLSACPAWDILWLGATFHVHPPYWHRETLGRDAEQTAYPNIFRTYGAFCTYAYIVNRASIAKLLTLLDQHLDRSIGIDWIMIQIQPQLYTYAMVPGSVIQVDGKSDIGKGITKFSGFSKLGPYWFAERAEDFDPTTFNWYETAK
jgi:GR25 family glycosyltransferase involved in LPS biosynthesis